MNRLDVLMSAAVGIFTGKGFHHIVSHVHNAARSELCRLIMQSKRRAAHVGRKFKNMSNHHPTSACVMKKPHGVSALLDGAAYGMKTGAGPCQHAKRYDYDNTAGAKLQH